MRERECANLLEQLVHGEGGPLLDNDSTLDDVKDLVARHVQGAVVLVHFVSLEPEMNPVEQEIGRKVVQDG